METLEMEKERLLTLLKGQNDKDAIGMILSNYTDYVNSDGGMVSVKQFDKVAECLLEWWKAKNEATQLPENWKEKLSDEYHLDITSDNWITGYDDIGKFYYKEEEVSFLTACFNELLKQYK